jgi:ribulose-phosphate 3-epimerase
MTDKIKKLRKWSVDRNLDFDIEVDGGVKANWTIATCADAGANCFIAGSGMFAYDDLSVGCQELRSIAVEAQKGKVLQASGAYA